LAFLRKKAAQPLFCLTLEYIYLDVLFCICEKAEMKLRKQADSLSVTSLLFYLIQ
jgi:hypothetical protein